MEIMGTIKLTAIPPAAGFEADDPYRLYLSLERKFRRLACLLAKLINGGFH